MLTHAALALLLTAQPVPSKAPIAAPPAAAPKAEAAQDRRRLDWLEQDLTERFKLELTPVFTDMGWPEEDRNWYFEKILPCAFRPRLKVVLTPADAQRLDRLKPRTKDGASIVADRLVRQWTANTHAYATAAWIASTTTDLSFDQLASDLKPGLLRLRFSTAYKPAGQIDRNAASTQIAADLADVLADPAFKGENARMVAFILGGIRKPDCDIKLLADAADKYAARPDADKWFADFFTAMTEKEIAWERRGTKIAADTTGRQMDGFIVHLGRAEAALARAQQLRPTWPDPARTMITIAMGQGGGATKSAIEWYDDVARIEPYDAWSAAYLAGAASPKWSGRAGWPWTLRILREAAACDDHRSTFPAMAVNAIVEAASGSSQNLAAIFKQPEVYDLAKKALSGYLTVPRGQGGISQDSARTWLMLFAYHAQKPAEVMAILKTPGFRPLPPNTVADVSPQILRLWGAIMGSEQSKPLFEAEGLTQAGDFDGALRIYGEVLPKLNAPGDDADLVVSRTLLINRLKKAAEGNRVSLAGVEQTGDRPGQSALLTWPAAKGWNARLETASSGDVKSDVLVFSPGTTCFYGTTDSTLYLPASLDIFKKKYELTFDALFDDAGQKNPGSIDVNLNHDAPGSPGEPYRLQANINAAQPRFDKAHSENPKADQPSSTPAKPGPQRRAIRILVDGWKGELWCDGELVDWSAGPVDADGRHTPGSRLSIGGNMKGECDVRIANLTIAALDEPLADRPRRERAAAPPTTR